MPPQDLFSEHEENMKFFGKNKWARSTLLLNKKIKLKKLQNKIQQKKKGKSNKENNGLKQNKQ